MTRPHNIWTDEEKEALLKYTEKCRNAQNRIDWDQVHEFMPHRTRTQLKAYYTNFLKAAVGIENTTNRLPTEGIADFLFTCKKCKQDWKLI